jgi:hypothetical protein
MKLMNDAAYAGNFSRQTLTYVQNQGYGDI